MTSEKHRAVLSTMLFLSLVSRNANLWNLRHVFSFALAQNSELLAVNETCTILKKTSQNLLHILILCLKCKKEEKKEQVY